MFHRQKVVIVHYWLDSYRGGEKVIESLCEIFPQADIFTHIYKPENLPETITSHKVYTSFIAKLPFAKKFYRHYLALMPIASFFLNLKRYDLIISSESGPAKGIRKRKDALHICYCHSPMRYIWDMADEYVSNRILIYRFIWKIIACYMRWWDTLSAKKVDFFIANSKFVAARIRKFYKRKSIVIHPPVEVHKYTNTQIRQNFYLCVSELVAYKKVILVVQAFNELKLPLIVIGGGDDLDKIRSLAEKNIKILGKVSDSVLIEKFETCKAFVYAGKEDFGIIFPEALSAGAPIIAYGKGGVRDVVENGKTGLFFCKQNVESMVKRVRIFEKDNSLFSSDEIAATARKFSKRRFKKEIINLINNILEN